MMAKKKIGQKIRELCFLIPFLVALSGIGVLAYQSLFCLKQGYWKPLGARLVLDNVLPTDFFQWLHNPSSWLGLNKIISAVFNFPLALFLPVFGLVSFLLVARACNLFSKPEKKISHFRQNIEPVLNSESFPAIFNILSSQNGHSNLNVAIDHQPHDIPQLS